MILLRSFDVVLAGAGLLLLSPLLAAIMLVLRFTGEGEVFYRQQRVGEGERMFGLLKFATMLKDSPNLGTGLLTVKGDPRVLPFGRLLRRTKLNELPQLWNVLVGDMSVIGPRPQAKPHFDIFPDGARQVIASARPGLSGIGSIVFRNEEDLLEYAADQEAYYRDVITPYKGEIEAWYVERRSPTLYGLLIALTLLALVAPGSRTYRRLLPDLPEPPRELAGL